MNQLLLWFRFLLFPAFILLSHPDLAGLELPEHLCYLLIPYLFSSCACFISYLCSVLICHLSERPFLTTLFIVAPPSMSFFAFLYCTYQYTYINIHMLYYCLFTSLEQGLCSLLCFQYPEEDWDTWHIDSKCLLNEWVSIYLKGW